MSDTSQDHLRPSDRNQVQTMSPEVMDRLYNVATPQEYPAEMPDIIKMLQSQIPNIYISRETLNLMKQKYQQQVNVLARKAYPATSKKEQLFRDTLLRRRDLLCAIVDKDRDHLIRYQQINSEKQQNIYQRNLERDRKISYLRNQKYVTNLNQKLNFRIAKKRSNDEKLMRELFEEMLHIQKKRLQDSIQAQEEMLKEKKIRERKVYDFEAMVEDENAEYMTVNCELFSKLREKQRRDREKKTMKDIVRRESRLRLEAELEIFQNKLIHDWEPPQRECEASKARQKLYNGEWRVNS